MHDIQTSGTGNPMALLRKMSYTNASPKLHMAATTPEIPHTSASQLEDKKRKIPTATKFSKMGN